MSCKDKVFSVFLQDSTLSLQYIIYDITDI